MKKILTLMMLLALFTLAACGQSDDASNDSKNANDDTKQTEVSKDKQDEKVTVSKPDARLEEPTADTKCEMCNMKVYEVTDDLGKFSGQAIKEDGTIAFYDDIGCLLNAELAHNEKNQKYVRDYNTLEWVLVDDATIVKTDLKSPMNWGYVFFKNKEDADQFIADNPSYKITALDVVKQEAKERREAKLKKQAEQQQQQQQGNMQNMQNMSHDGHNH